MFLYNYYQLLLNNYGEIPYNLELRKTTPNSPTRANTGGDHAHT